MRKINKLLAVLAATISVAACSANSKPSFNYNPTTLKLSSLEGDEEESFDNNPVLKSVKENKGVGVLFLENGLRDGNGLMKHETINSVLPSVFKQNTDGYIIKAGNYEILVDCGLGLTASNSTDKTLSYLSACSQLVEIMSYLCEDHVWEAVIFTHQHADHIIGVPYLVDIASGIIPSDFSIDKVYDFMLPGGGYPNTTQTRIYADYQTYMLTLGSDKHISVPNFFYDENGNERNDYLDGYLIKKTVAGKSFNLEFFKNPDYAHSQYPNYSSVAFLIKYGKQKLLFSGDLEEPGETYLRNNYADKIEGVTFFKAGHHGSGSGDESKKRANSREFIEHIRPQYVMVPAVAGSVEHTENRESTFPSYAAVDRYFKYTDQIYIPSSAILNTTADGKLNVKDYKTMYGDACFLFDGEDVEVKTTNLCDKNNHPNVPIYNTKWFGRNREAFFSYYTLIEDNINNHYYNCSLFKFGHIDIVVDCGSRMSDGAELVKKLEKIVVDKKIEYLVVSHGENSSINGLMGTKSGEKRSGKGLFDKFTVEKVIDFGRDCKISEGQAPNYKLYKEIISKLGDKYVPVNDTVYPRDIATIRSYSDYGDYEFVEDGKGTFKDNIIKMTIIDPIEGTAKDENNNSLVTIITYQDKKIVNIGDLEDYENLIKNYKADLENTTL